MISRDEAINQVGDLPDYLYIDGQRVQDAALDSIESVDPGSGKRIGAVPAGSEQNINDAVAAAKRALQGPWADMHPRDRGRLLWQVGDAIQAQKERLALIETLDSGKPLRDAEIGVDRTAEYFRYYAGMVDKLEGSSIPLGKDKVCFTEHVPIGVTGHIVKDSTTIDQSSRNHPSSKRFRNGSSGFV